MGEYVSQKAREIRVLNEKYEMELHKNLNFLNILLSSQITCLNFLYFVKVILLMNIY